ncbi:fimbrial protein [Proteus hauseri]|uniref:Fimbrial protein n=1 Tax=Proteus cibi TaxID=2050966 RepID=A0ABU6EC12_9GAMM|nr:MULTISPECIES: fimbrial protein [Proteus]MBG6029765.1 fimbrial protein [Proteus hauseri]MBS6210594.1 fimbrial protein [Proteus hauseri]MEB6856185.1 fimbrial protein [Proteus cibi]MEB7087822.1 fimbrial protein [Proteus cibi]
MKSSAFIFLMLLGAISQQAIANCKPENTITAPNINFDLSADLNATSTTVTKSSRTTFPGTFKCNARGILFPNTVGIASPFNDGRTGTIGFNGGKQFVSITLTALEKDNVTNIPAGIHPASDLDTNFTLKFTLLSSKPSTNYTEVSGSSVVVNPVVLASDASSVGLVQWLLNIVIKLVQFLLTWQWPVDQNDIFLQPMLITYNPVMTTCNFSNAGLVVSLPSVSVNDAKTADKAGYTPFTLNFTCQDFLSGSKASRNIKMFLSSQNLLATDKTVLTNTTTQGANGVGFRLVKSDNTASPLILSDNINTQGSATSIFSVNQGGSISSAFAINMGAYYYPYNINSVTQGKITSSATLVMSYD